MEMEHLSFSASVHVAIILGDSISSLKMEYLEGLGGLLTEAGQEAGLQTVDEAFLEAGAVHLDAVVVHQHVVAPLSADSSPPRCGPALLAQY